MITIKRETIIKAGDTIVNTENKAEWKVSKIDGYTFYMADKAGKEKVMTKFDMMVHPELKLKLADERGYY